MPFQSPARSAPSASAMRMPSPVSKRVPGEISRMVSAPGPKCRSIISALPWKPPQASTTASAGSVSRLFARRHDHAGNAAAVDHQLLGATAVADVDAGRRGGAREGADQPRPAADRLDARRAFRQVVRRLDERDAVRRPSRRPSPARARRASRNSARRPCPGSRPACPARSSARPDRAPPCACWTATSACCRRRRPRAPCRSG